MKKRSTKKSTLKRRTRKQSASISPANQDVVGLLTVLVQKLTSFEAKIDTVLGRISAPQAAVPTQQPPLPPFPHLQNREPRPMHQAVCADCSRGCEVPFKPREDRPVYCKECFAKRKSKGVVRSQAAVPPKAEPQECALSVAKPVVTSVKAPAKKKPAAKKKKSARK